MWGLLTQSFCSSQMFLQWLSNRIRTLQMSCSRYGFRLLKLGDWYSFMFFFRFYMPFFLIYICIRSTSHWILIDVGVFSLPTSRPFQRMVTCVICSFFWFFNRWWFVFIGTLFIYLGSCLFFGFIKMGLQSGSKGLGHEHGWHLKFIKSDWKKKKTKDITLLSEMGFV